MVRRRMAERRGLPAYMILHDSALREMARRYPRSIEGDWCSCRVTANEPVRREIPESNRRT